MGNPQFLALAGPTGAGIGTLQKLPRVVLADDNSAVLEEIRSLLEAEFRLVSLATDGNALMQAVRASKPDIVVTDVQMPGRNGIDVGRDIVKLGLCNAVVVLSLYADSQLIQTALDGGIRGYVLKDDAGEELIPALRAVLSGGRYLSQSVAGFGRR